jgi:hypothetical protein
MQIYKLVSEDLSMIGGPMHLARSFENYSKVFSTPEKAKEYAEKEYNNSERKIIWEDAKEYSDAILTSGDLGFVMYNIFEEELD